MLTYNRVDLVEVVNGVAKNYVEGACLSTDTKPTTGIANGSSLIEMDTSKILFYDESNTQWREF